MLVVTNLVLPCVTNIPNACYATTHQRFHFTRGLLDFIRLVVTNFIRSTDDNVHYGKLEIAYLSRFSGANNGADSGAQTPPRGVFRSVTVAVPTHTFKRPQKPVSAQKKEGENEQ